MCVIVCPVSMAVKKNKALWAQLYNSNHQSQLPSSISKYDADSEYKTGFKSNQMHSFSPVYLTHSVLLRASDTNPTSWAVIKKIEKAKGTRPNKIYFTTKNIGSTKVAVKQKEMPPNNPPHLPAVVTLSLDYFSHRRTVRLGKTVWTSFGPWIWGVNEKDQISKSKQK